MTIVLENYPLPEQGQVKIKVDVSFEMKVSAEQARRKVNRWVMERVSSQMGAELPTLIIGERAVWRVPVHISFPDTGRIRGIGAVDVDAETGEMNDTPEHRAEIERAANDTALQLPPYQPKRGAPAKYLAKNVPPAEKLIFTEDGQIKPAV